MSRIRIARWAVGMLAVTGAFAVHRLGAQATARNAVTDRVTLDQYLDMEDVQTPRLSPDGKQVLYTRRWIDKMNDRWESALWLSLIHISEPTRLLSISYAVFCL